MSFSFAFIGIVTTIYIYFYNNLNYKYVPMLLLFYSGMELLQGTQYYIVNQCNNPANKLLTELAYLFVLVQPLMWNYFYYVNSNKCDKNIFLTAIALSMCWMATSIYTRLTYTKNNGIDSHTKNNDVNSYLFSDSVCTKKNKTHLYWNWTSANIQDFNPTMLMYVMVWFIPALLSARHKSTSMIIILSFIIAYISSSKYSNEPFTLTSLWCYFSVPIVLIIIYKNIR
jgi:hypothetical protein